MKEKVSDKSVFLFLMGVEGYKVASAQLYQTEVFIHSNYVTTYHLAMNPLNT